MSATFRTLIAAFIVALASLGGALYLAHERSLQTGDAAFGGNGGLATVDLHALLATSQQGDAALLSTAFHRVEDTYYKPVTAQLLLNGERHELIDVLHQHKVRDPQIPELAATGDQSRDETLLNSNLKLAESTYGKQVGDALLTQAAIRGMLNALGDPYTTYLSPREISTLEESLRGGDFGGIGVYIVQDPRTKHVIVIPSRARPPTAPGSSRAT